MKEWEQGLSEKEARRRLAQDGENRLRKAKGKNGLQIFLEQLKDPLIYVLLVAAFVSVLLKEYSDAAIIGVVVLLNAFVGMIQEGKAKKALEALQNLQSPSAFVIREGRKREIPASELVVGDLVCLEAGGRVPADLRLLEAVNLKIEESALTGESLPVEKDAGSGRVEGNLSLGDRKSAAYMSTIVMTGRGKGIVTATGMQTELGRIADMIHQEKEELTPLQKRLGELGMVLSLLSLLLCGALFGIAVWQKRNVIQMLLTAISLAVAAVPEGLPAVVTICLALSVTRMVKANTIVRKLPSVETLGAVSVVCSDKTGTLTQNRMTAEMGYWDGKVHALDGSAVPPEEFLRGLVLCNEAVLARECTGNGKGRRDLEASQQQECRKPFGGKVEKQDLGDPTELALLQLGRGFGMEKSGEASAFPRVNEIPFDSESKRMVTFHQGAQGVFGYCKGAPDVVLGSCRSIWFRGSMEPLKEGQRREIRKAISLLSGQAYRLLAVAKGVSHGQGGKQGSPAFGDLEWTFLGLVAMRDPVRPQVPRAVQLLKQAGVQTVMITGDHVETALAVGRQLEIATGKDQCMTGAELAGLDEEELARQIDRRRLRIFARVSPAQKVQIVKAFQRQGGIVAMTGDGVNDAPSLKAADIGIAMGKNGTDVAKQAADMVLTDDNFATIERAIEEGRGVYENIRKSVIFLLSSNLGELLTMFTAVCLGFAAPLRSSHILWINLITDSLPALALGVDPNDGASLMEVPPRRTKESLFARGGFGCTCFYGLLIAGISLTAFCLPAWPLLREAHGLAEMREVVLGSMTKSAFLTRGQTYAFTVLGMSQLFHAIGMRDVNRSVFRMKHLRNRLMLLAFAVGFSLQFAVTEVPFLVKAFGTAPLNLREWTILIMLSALPLLAHEIIAVLWGRKK